MASNSFSAACRSSIDSLFAFLPRYSNAAPTPSTGESRIETPHFSKFLTTLGSNSIAKLSTGALGIALAIWASL